MTVSGHHKTDNDESVTSPEIMSAGTLSEQVIAARTAKRMNASRLQNESGLSARTIRDIESGNRLRRYAPTTLGRLDGPLGWKPGTAWGLWMEQTQTPSGEFEHALDELARRLTVLEQQPPWAAEVIEVFGALEPADRHRLTDLARRVAELSSRVPRYG